MLIKNDNNEFNDKMSIQYPYIFLSAMRTERLAAKFCGVTVQHDLISWV